MSTIHVVKRDGTREPFDANKINLALVAASEGLPDQISKVVQVATELQLTLFDGITSEQLDEAVIHTALQNVKEDPDFDKIAARLLLKNIYKNILGDYTSAAELKKLHETKFADYIKESVKSGLLDERMNGKVFDLKRLAKALDPTRDDLSKYLGVVTNKNRYALRKQSGAPIEVPQFTHMRIAMGLSFNEADPTAAAIDFYEHMSRLEYTPGGSTRVNAGGSFPQLSNCFLVEVQDDMESIAKGIRDTMWIAKGTGGIGISLNKLRASGSPVKTTNTESTGPIPFMKMIDTALFAVSRKGKKAGAAALYMENWHLNFPQFLDLKQNSGDPYLRTRFANTAVFISDEFMKRVQKAQDWYLFDPAETPDLPELYGAEFSAAYANYIKKAERGEMRDFQKINAREQFYQILTVLQATSHPWLTWKDTINVRALNNNTSTIHLSNLCTEITLPQDKDNTAVCNLVSINLSAHLNEDKTWDWARLEESTRSAIRQLDNLCDITNTPIPEAMHSNLQNRALGLGVMGFTDVIEKLGYSYESEEAYDLIDQLTEFVSYQAIDESANLAQKLGSYPTFKGSGWSKGILPFDTIDQLAADRKVKVEVNVNLVNDLKKLGIWDDVKEDVLRLQGDVQQIDAIPQHIKDVYKTSFQLSPYSFIEVAARAQKWVDQAISRNMYLETRNIDDYIEIYTAAWKRGLKTTYYLHVKPRHTAEQSTVKVNKSESGTGPRKSGFGFAKKQSV